MPSACRPVAIALDTSSGRSGAVLVIAVIASSLQSDKETPLCAFNYPEDLTATSQRRNDQFSAMVPPIRPPPVAPPDLLQPHSVRERLEERRRTPACASCHTLTDPIGFALENFDAVGSWRSMDSGLTARFVFAKRY